MRAWGPVLATSWGEARRQRPYELLLQTTTHAPAPKSSTSGENVLGRAHCSPRVVSTTTTTTTDDCSEKC